jgi:lipoyl(octanoyl) transferase
MKNQTIFFKDLGLTDYQKALSIQTHFFDTIKNIKIQNKQTGKSSVTNNYLLFTEHPHVYTLGKSGKEEHLLIDAKEREKKSVQFIKTNRGGDITYHGPGQIVCYPIIDLDNFNLEILSYMRLLEEVIINVLAQYNIKGERSKGETGVWIDVDKPSVRKICAMGVKTSRWVTMHGFALNVHTDLSYFDHIIPCGIQNKGVTSMQTELQKKVDISTLKKEILKSFAQTFGATIVDMNHDLQ